MTVESEKDDPDGLEARVIETLIDLREERGWSQSELARRMAEAGWSKYTQMTVSRTEKGERPIRLNEAEALAKVFGVDLYNLWLPRRLRLYSQATEQVDRLAAELEKLIERYLTAQSVLATRADNIDLAEDEIGYVAEQLEQTPEVIAAKVRASIDRGFDRFAEEMRGDFKSPYVLEVEKRFWKQSASERSLRKLFGELNGEHQETS